MTAKRIVTTDVDIVHAVTKILKGKTAEDIKQTEVEYHITDAAWQIVHELTREPERVSDITGFEEDDH